MMKHEFEERIGKEISQEDYDKVEKVYMNYPEIHDKDQIADLYNTFGMRIIRDMLPRAERIVQLETRKRKYKLAMEEIEEQIKQY